MHRFTFNDGFYFVTRRRDPVRHEPAAPRSRVKHSTTEPLRSYLQFNGGGQLYILRKPVFFMVPEGVQHF